MPSFAVETDGTLHTALMRSCTGWPSGVWIDEPRRTAPDGSNFQLQHWTHIFDYALVCGAGDWRQAEVPDRSAEFSRPLLAVTAPGRVRGLPATGSLLQVDPAGAVQLGALKAAGNPLARGSAHPVDPGQVAIRLVETRGGDTDVVVRSPLGSVSELHPADLLERPRLRSRSRHLTTLHGHQIGTALARLDLPGCWTPKTPRWRRSPRTASRCTRGTGCTTADRRRWAGCPPSPTCIRTRSPPQRAPT